MCEILIVGGGYAGFSTAWGLEKKPGRGEARHATVSLRRHLHRTRLVAGTVTEIRITEHTVTETAFGLTHVEEAVAIRDRLLTSFDRAASLPRRLEGRKLLTVTSVGEGFSGAEGSLEKPGPPVHLNTQLVSAEHRHVVMSSGEDFDTGMLVWSAGNASNPVVQHHTDPPVDERGLPTVRADLRVGMENEPVAGVGAVGDDASVPDLAVQIGPEYTRFPTLSTPCGWASGW